MSETESGGRQKKPRFTKAEIQFNISNAINRLASATAHGPPFRSIFHIVEPVPGAREVLLEHAGQVVEYVSENAVTCEILRFCHHDTNWPMFRAVDEAGAKAAMKFWKAFTPAIPEPKMIREKSDAGLCFHRLPFDVAAVPTPVFDEFLSRTENATALCAFIGSLLVPEADRQQYVYLHGDGMNGKGALLRFLARVMGPAYAAKVPPNRHGDNFWTYGLLGKRLVAFPDCSDRHFPASPLFKMLTGGDHVPVEQKGHQAYTAPLSCKFIFASNDEPKLSGQEADRRRAIYCEVGRINGEPDPHYDDRLWAEAAGILWKCRACYKDLTVDHGPIRTEADSLDALIEKNSGRFEEIFEDCFALDTRPGIADCQLLHFSQAELARIVATKRLDDDFRAAFIKWMRYEHGIIYKNVRVEPKRRRVFVGACVKTEYAVDTEMDRAAGVSVTKLY